MKSKLNSKEKKMFGRQNILFCNNLKKKLVMNCKNNLKNLKMLCKFFNQIKKILKVYKKIMIKFYKLEMSVNKK
jgi:hypothetical protein